MATDCQFKPVDQEDLLRISFVEMLFALAVGQVAVHAADLVGAEPSPISAGPAWCHLILGLMVIAASYVGWRSSVSPGGKEPVRYIWSRQFVHLALDVVLVILYFVIVRSVELQQKDGHAILTKPTASPEAIQLAWVFGVYAIWDLFVDIFAADCLPPLKGFRWCGKLLLASFASVLASVICAVLCLLVWRLSLGQDKHWCVVALDLSLLCVVVLFRDFKAIENPLSRLLRLKDCKAFATPRVLRGTECRWSCILIVAYALSIFWAYHASDKTLKLSW